MTHEDDSFERQKEAYRHELCYIKNDDFGSGEDVRIIENRTHDIQTQKRKKNESLIIYKTGVRKMKKLAIIIMSIVITLSISFVSYAAYEDYDFPEKNVFAIVDAEYLTEDIYNSMLIGMTYPKVYKIMSFDGAFVFDFYDGSQNEYTAFMWKPALGVPFILLTFKNGKLYMKTQFLLKS